MSKPVNHSQLVEKIEAEYKEYKQKFRGKTAPDMMDGAFQFVVKTELLSVLTNTEYSYETTKRLLAMKNTLDELYWEAILDHTDEFTKMIDKLVSYHLLCE